eukprot:Plantae.Rhodophyta-Hildenbrandia_rubra.ctg16531.p1 GENE.Plantae.Rhodophyta-Hildenbrandia_rubra.ctg16531~~Plantae.Rhodophyta-Hildenbrandia_rubra.ctg16531.p1  ORF type:complete len:813 (-),score=174.21 Plantae.Rhodophyta-Hildenbrandia_rubra.ctg16531:2495-4933(-)
MVRREDEPTYTPANVIKVIISTDNHLGYLEKDPIRGDDSFRTFEEMLSIAQANDADMVLLGGDLFHDNKPSRRTTLRTMSILRKFCLGPKPVSVAVRSKNPKVNYMDPCYAVQLPVFAIHGNHDDPTGSAGTEALSAIDILSASNLVTYFGKAHQSQRITISPILLQKGITKLALFGLGNVGDERLYNTWHTEKKVHWQRPAVTDDDDGEAWYNVFVLHQNRAIRGTAKAISDSMLPDWLNLVIWGHEHESIPDTPGRELPPIAQPGSTVATSLSEGESRQKHCALLEVYKGDEPRLRWIKLQTTRWFLFETISLSNIQKDQEKRGLLPGTEDEKDDDAEIVINPGDEKSVSRYLLRKVENMVATAVSCFDSRKANWYNGTVTPEPRTKFPPKEYYMKILEDTLRMPLIRLRVEYSGGYEPLNPGRFGQDFLGKVASPSDILLFYRRRVIKRKRFLGGRIDGSGTAVPGTEDEEDPLAATEDGEEGDVSGGDEMENGDPTKKMDVPRLVQYYLYSGGKDKIKGVQGLKFLELDSLSSAVEKFVEKAETKAIPEYVNDYLEERQKATLENQKANGQLLTEDQIREKCERNAYSAAARVFTATLKKKQAARTQGDGFEADAIEDGANDKDMEIDADKEATQDQDESTDINQLRQKVALAANRKLASIQEVIGKVPTLADKDATPSDDEDDDDDDEEEVLPKKRRSRRAPTRRKPPAPRRKATTAQKRKRSDFSDDDVIMEDDDYSPPAKKKRTTTRRTAAPKKTRTSRVGSQASRAGSQATLLSGSSFTRRRGRPVKSSASILLDSDDEGDNAM